MKTNEEHLDECHFVHKNGKPLKIDTQWVEWVPYKENDQRLENHHSYLVSDGFFVTTAWFDCDGFAGCESDLITEITHWMPLPNPPKES